MDVNSKKEPLTVSVDGEQVPKALLTAFAQPSKDKKPFSYFPGDKPDLSAHPSPSTVKKSNPVYNGPSIPRVLPFVSDQDLKFDEKKDAPQSEEMATLTHAQYNSPMPLYSKENVDEVLHQTQGFLDKGRPHSAASGQFNPAQSGAYRLLQENGQISAAHSARLDEQKDEYPHYRGFVDPRVQSPSFKRLQYVTGMDSGAEDEISHELHPPARARTDEPRSGVESRQSVGSQHDSTYQHQHQQHEEYKPQWNDDIGGPRVAQRDPTSADREQPIDPTLAARIAEAERPKVPPPVVPSWARKAEEKRQKWQHYGDQYQHRNYEYQPPQANWEGRAQNVQDKWSTHYGTTRQETYENAPRARSAEPHAIHRSRPAQRESGRKEWMKPFIAPNVLNTRFTPPSQPSYSPLSAYRNRPSGRTHETSTYSTSYNPASATARPYSSLSTTSSNYQRSTTPHEYSTYTSGPQRYQTSSTTRYEQTTSGYSTPKKEVNVATLVSDEALNRAPHETNTSVPWSKHAEYKRTVWESKRSSVDPEYHQRAPSSEPAPPWAQRAEQTHTLWQHEADAWKQKQQMESDLRRRATSAAPETQYRGSEQRGYESSTTSSNRGTSPSSWRQRPVPHEVSTYTGSTTGAPQRWQPASGGETKTQSSGTYTDRDGNQVSYTKEVYTSSDPGKEFSMLSEQEKKILEEPLQPGVVSRHVTTKYYKKSTYTSSTTTNTSQAPPVTTTIRYEYPATTTTTSSGQYQRGTSEY